MRVAILAMEHSAPAGVLVVWDMFSMAAALRDCTGNPPLKTPLETWIVSHDGRPLAYSDFFEIRPHGSLEDVGDVDLIIVPTGGYRVGRLKNYPEKTKRWIAENHARGVIIAGICTGVFLLAESGILTGKAATTHWAFADEFRKNHPDVIFTPEKIITCDGGVFCSGGGSAGVDLTLFLVGRFLGRDRARILSRMFLLEQGRQVQNPYADSVFIKNHKDLDILKAQQFIENRLSENISMDHVAEYVGMSLRNFKRRFKAATGEPPLVYLQKIRMEKAKLILENDDMRIERLAEQVGYDDIGFFRKLFLRHTGVSPRDYRRRFRHPEN